MLIHIASANITLSFVIVAFLFEPYELFMVPKCPFSKKLLLQCTANVVGDSDGWPRGNDNVDFICEVHNAGRFCSVTVKGRSVVVRRLATFDGISSKEDKIYDHPLLECLGWGIHWRIQSCCCIWCDCFHRKKEAHQKILQTNWLAAGISSRVALIQKFYFPFANENFLLFSGHIS